MKNYSFYRHTNLLFIDDEDDDDDDEDDFEEPPIKSPVPSSERKSNGVSETEKVDLQKNYAKLNLTG